MATNYIFSLQPTFTQGLILGQLSILCLLYLILKYLFLDSTQDPFDNTASYNPYVPGAHNVKPLADNGKGSFDEEESAEWLNVLLQQLLGLYRSRLRDYLTGVEGDEVSRKRIEEYANKIRPVGFLDCIKIHSVDLGSLSPRILKGKYITKPGSDNPTEIKFSVEYVDTISLSLSTSYLFNYPISSFARLPVDLTISLSLFKADVTVIPPSAISPPVLTISLSPDFILDLSTSSHMGSRAKLTNVPKLHELIQHQIRQVLASRGPWKVPLPILTSVPEIKEEIKEELKEKVAAELYGGFM